MSDNTINSCPACKSDKISGRWTICRFDKNKEIRWCGECGYGWQYPLPGPDEILGYYKKFSTYSIHGENEKEKGFRKRISQINKMMPKRGSLLDVGSGLGYFLKVAQNYGWKATGIEPQASAAEYCRSKLNIDVHAGFINDLNLKPESFDVLTLWDVLEHVYDPLIFLDQCIKLVAPGGLVIIAVPNASGWPARIFKAKWRYSMYTHLSYFTLPYICKIIKSRHLDIERANHTIKVHSLLQGFGSYLPIKIDTERIIRLGRINSAEQCRPEQSKARSKFENSIYVTNMLNRIRQIILDINLAYLPLPVGDLVDIYCRKKR